MAQGKAAWMLATMLLILSGCATHQLRDVPLQHSYALPAAPAGTLFEATQRIEQLNGAGKSTYLALADNLEALRWRLLLADLATETLDAQYYLWNGDASGKLLVLHLLDAADRGVRVRLLVDDVFTIDSDTNIAAINSHPNIEIRIFNPWKDRGSLLRRMTEYIGSSQRLNQRMHNKLFVADNHVAIVGGRNIGNPYFGLGEHYNFRDLEVVTAGPVTEDISDSFDLYWNDDWAVTGEAFSPPGYKPPDIAASREALRAELQEMQVFEQAGLEYQLHYQQLLAELVDASDTGDVWVVYDDPPAAVANDTGVRKVAKLQGISKTFNHDLVIASAYFIPDELFLDNLRALTERGVRVRVITNSLASTNHTMVNSGYAPWRRRLLEAGVELFEYRGDIADTGGIVAPGINSHAITLHTKAFVVDNETVYIGSLNMDPRSLHINTEMGLLIRDPGLATEVMLALQQDMQPENSWRVSLNEDNELTWESTAGTVQLQPARSFGQRVADFLYGLLPIKDQL
ncbi:MAG: phospholipase D family protein [Gammaproteobacteria bacterium]|nr:phospholipase D family protein [Gammaproteobacteria bacterium]